MEEMLSDTWTLIWAWATDWTVQIINFTMLTFLAIFRRGCKHAYNRMAKARQERLDLLTKQEKERKEREEEEARPSLLGKEILAELRYPTVQPKQDNDTLVIPGKLRIQDLSSNVGVFHRVFVSLSRDRNGEDVWRDYTAQLKKQELQAIIELARERFNALVIAERDAEESLALETLRRNRKATQEFKPGVVATSKLAE